jgi:two-component system, NtrC family, response regulator GlrR
MTYDRTTSFDDETTTAAASLAMVLRRPTPTVHWRDRTGERSLLVTERTLIGSSESVGLRVLAPTVSRVHAELEPRQDGVWLRDLGSKNGVAIDRVWIKEARLHHGATVRLGDVELSVRYADAQSNVVLWREPRFGALFGKSTVMRELFARLARVAASDAAILIQGETGTGKELVARSIHDASPRARSPFIVVDCAAMPDNLLEAELFGHTRGAFTGAHTAREGAFEAASGGTIFLDEVGELPLAMQPKLLRVLESRTIRRVGESQHRPVNVRVVTATHRDLAAMVASGAFREDLYFRLAVLPVRVPPLREREDDAIELARSFLPEPMRAAALDPTLERALLSRPWVGNVRELRNVMDRVVSLGPSEALDGEANALSRSRPSAAARGEWSEGPTVDSGVPFKVLRDQWLDHLERAYLTALIAQHGRNITAVAAAAGLDRSYIHRLIKKHDL